MGERTRLCSVSDLDDCSSKRFDVGRHRIALVRIGEDFYAIGDTCSHAEVSLSEGDVLCDELEIECWKHGSTFDLKTGEPQSLPATKPVPVYSVSVEDDDVWVTVP
jgi:3-phenylpropionate/trans-cinnamate dioxygenase ferredoxin subunit